MKFTLIIDKTKEPSVTVITDKVNETVAKIESLCASEGKNAINGYKDNEITPISVNDVSRFYTDGGKVYVSKGGEAFLIKMRIKDVEEIVGENFIKINQGCIANVNKIKKFKASIGGALMVVFNDDSCDYVSRRELKNVKRRLGL